MKNTLLLCIIGENEEHTTRTLIQIVNETLNMQWEVFRGIFRVGKHTSTNGRPINAETVKYNLKASILSCTKDKLQKLNNRYIFFFSDFAKKKNIGRKYLHHELRHSKADFCSVLTCLRRKIIG